MIRKSINYLQLPQNTTFYCFVNETKTSYFSRFIVIREKKAVECGPRKTEPDKLPSVNCSGISAYTRKSSSPGENAPANTFSIYFIFYRQASSGGEASSTKTIKDIQRPFK